MYAIFNVIWLLKIEEKQNKTKDNKQFSKLGKENSIS